MEKSIPLEAVRSSKKRRLLTGQVHFIGIGGIGMSALARYFLALNRAEGLALSAARQRRPFDKLRARPKMASNWLVSGSDTMASPLTQKLAKEGVNVKIGHLKGHVTPDLDLVVYSQAITPDNPELREAKRLHIPCRSYPEAVGRLTEKYRTIAVAGSHGKSTTAALIGLILKKASFDPTIIIGTELKELDGKNFRLGRGKYLVLEADEFGRAFHHYSPAFAIVTNVDREHLDVYQSLAGVQKGFLEFIGKIKTGGVAVLNKDNEPLVALESKIAAIARHNNIKVIWYSLYGSVAKKIKRALKIPGIHNVSNALAAYRLAAAMKIPGPKILSVFRSYRGSSRRFEYRGTCQVSGIKCQVYDDYAHHPTEIKATLQAFREKYPDSKIVCVFQPHQAKRLEALFKEFQTAFDGADTTLVLPIYKVAGRDKVKGQMSNVKCSSEALVRAIQKLRPARRVFYLKNPKHLKSALTMLLSSPPPPRPPRQLSSRPRKSASRQRQSALVVMMGAGDIVNYTDSLIK